MKIKSLMQSSLAKFSVSAVLAAGFTITGMLSHSFIGLQNPSFILALFFIIQTNVIGFTFMIYGNLDGSDSEEQRTRESQILGPLRIITAGVLLTLANLAGLPTIYQLIIAGFTLWLMLSGIMGVAQQYFPHILKKRREMRNSRMEESLLEDLTGYLIEAGFSESDPTDDSKR